MYSNNVLALTRPWKNPIAPTEMGEGLSKIGTAMLATQIYSTLVLQQPDFTASDGEGEKVKSIINNLNNGQKIARQHGEKYLNTIAPSLIGAISGINGYATQYQVFSQAINGLLPKLVAESTREKTRKEIIALLTQLKIDAQRKLTTVRNLAGDVEVYKQQFETDAENFEKVVEAADKEIGSDSGELSKIKRDIEDTQQSINGTIGGVVISALVIVGGGIVIAVGALAALPAGVTSAAVILPGIVLVATGTAALAGLSAKLASDNTKLADLYMQAAKVNATLVLMQHVKGQIDPLMAVISQVHESVNGLNIEWANIVKGIADFQAILERADLSDVAYIESSLKLAANAWNSVADSVKNVEHTLTTASTQNVKDVTKVPSAA